MKRSYFLQQPAQIRNNQYEDDKALKEALKRIIPKEILSKFEQDLSRLGKFRKN
jgi:hypothetical protein